MTTFCESGAGRPGSARHVSTRFTRMCAVLLAALCAPAFAPQQFAAAAQTTAAFFIGNDGTLYTYGRAGDGSVITVSQLGGAQVAPPGGSVAATQAPGGGSVAFYVGNDGALYGACPDNGQVSQLTAPGLGSPGEPNSAALVGGQTVYDAFLGANRQALQVVEIHNPCGPPSVALLSPALPPPPPPAALAAVGLADGEFGLFYVDGTGALQALWSTATGVWTATQLTAAGTSAPGGGVAVTPNSGAPAVPGALSLFFTAHNGSVYLAHPLPGGKLSDNPKPSPSTKGTYAPDGAALAASSDSTGSVVGYVSSNGAVIGGSVTASGWVSVPVALTVAGFATAGSSAASVSFEGDADFYCGTTLGRPTISHWPHGGGGGGGGGSVLYLGPSGLTGAATGFAAN